jgi:hydroxymethylglutaryl-CoA lyase/(R)-citramalyl-CoA lyase
VTDSVVICDVGPRDGLQMEAVPVAVATRAELCRRLASAGLPRIEAVSFVRDELVPAMADPEGVVAALDLNAALHAGLVLNEHGYERLAATGLPLVHVTFGVTETFQQRNAGSSVAGGVERAEAIARRARADGRSVSAVLSCAFGCPYEGVVDDAAVADLAGRAAAFADDVVLADTIGVATPGAVRRAVGHAVGESVQVGVHLHDTRGTAVACALAAVDAGAVRLDASVGGVGGCPFAPGAQGNVATEDLVYVLEREGIRTGVDLDALVETARWLELVLGRSLPGHVHRADRWPA